MFKMNLFVTFLCVSVLRISLAIQDTRSDASKECDGKTVYLTNANKGMRFYSKGNNVTYDCLLENSYKGTIDLDDEQHSPSIDYLFIKNCEDITLNLKLCNSFVKSVHVMDVEKLRIISTESYPLEIVITNVKTLYWSSETKNNPNWSYERRYNSRDCFENYKTSLILKNVVVTHFDDNSINNIHMTGVIAERFTPGEISSSTLSIKDSRFDYLAKKSFYGEAKQVYIVNTTFGTLSSQSFNLRVNESFVFSDNHVIKMFDAFNIICPKVEIVGNTIDYAKYSSFRVQLSHPDFSESIFKSLNVSFNKMKHIFVWLTEDSEPDFLAITRNHFNCSCATSLHLERLVRSNSSDIIGKLLLDDDSNVCLNFGNCPLRKLSGKELSVCKNTFVCPDDSSQVSAITLKIIESELKNLTESLHSFMEQNQKLKHSNITSSKNDIATNHF